MRIKYQAAYIDRASEQSGKDTLEKINNKTAEKRRPNALLHTSTHKHRRVCIQMYQI